MVKNWFFRRQNGKIALVGDPATFSPLVAVTEIDGIWLVLLGSYSMDGLTDLPRENKNRSEVDLRA